MEVLNRNGKCCSYTTIAELETEVTFSSRTENAVSPLEMIDDLSLPSGSAYNSFDRNVETSPGKDTSHDMVGSAFQRVCTENTPILPVKTNSKTSFFQIVRK